MNNQWSDMAGMDAGQRIPVPTGILRGATSEPGLTRVETPVIETMLVTANRLEEIERKVNILSAHLFGAEPAYDECKESVEGNVLSLANSACYSSRRLENMLDEIYRRLADGRAT
ncbi:hypothetical protein AB6A23_11155 [Paenibacillus tarimensis]